MSKIHDYNLDLEELQKLFDNDSMWEHDFGTANLNIECQHDWKETVLIFGKVYDCRLCGKKKEDL